MLNHGSRSLAWLLSLSLIAVACGDDDDDTGGTGGTSGKGGSTSAGGKSATGGTTTSGGTSAKGGTTSTGGTATSGGKGNATGGVVSTGGTATTGGTDAGGASGEGGMPEGGSPTGGTGTGGSTTTGGSSTTGGTAGTSTGGTAGADNGGAGGFGGDSVVGGAGGEGGEVAVQITIVNPGFDTPVWADPPTGWTETGDGAACYTAEDGPHSGLRYLNLWDDVAYVVTWSQIISSIPNGNYSLAMWHQGGEYIEQYAFARGYDSSDTAAKVTKATAASAPWEQIVVSPIPVTNGQIEIGVYSNAAATNWSHFDEVTLTKLP